MLPAYIRKKVWNENTLSALILSLYDVRLLVETYVKKKRKKQMEVLRRKRGRSRRQFKGGHQVWASAGGIFIHGSTDIVDIEA